MNAEFVNPFITGLLNVLETMAQTTLKPGKPKRKQSEIHSLTTLRHFSLVHWSTRAPTYQSRSRYLLSQLAYGHLN